MFALRYVMTHGAVDIKGVMNGYTQEEISHHNVGYRHLSVFLQVNGLEHICELGLHVAALHEKRQSRFDSGGQGRAIIWADSGRGEKLSL